MTSASELLYQRRSRAGRDVELPPIEAASSRPSRSGLTTVQHHFHRSHHRHHYDCPVSLRFENLLHQDDAPLDCQVQFSEQSSSSSTQRNEISIEIASGRNGRESRCVSIFTEQAIQNNKQRGAVMQAKDRLHERFRASSLVGNRHSSSASTAVCEYPHLSDAVYWETEVGRHFLALNNGQSEEVLPMEVSPSRISKHQGLNKIAISNLPTGFFVPRPRTRSKGSGVGNTELEQEVCPVCLEHFLSGEQLIRLACCHRFHPSCLTPWLKICGECPCCRAKV